MYSGGAFIAIKNQNAGTCQTEIEIFRYLNWAGFE